jgi:hypothetical protein
VDWLPLAAAALIALWLAPGLLSLLARGGVVRENYRGVVLPGASGR